METAEPGTAYGMPNEHEPAPWSDTAMAMAAALAEVANQLPALDALIAERESDVRVLKDLRKRVAAVLGENARPAGKRTVAPRETTVAAVSDWLQDHFNSEEDITTRRVLEVWTDGTFNRDTIRRALAVLEERGTLRLERTAQGGGKVYRLV